LQGRAPREGLVGVGVGVNSALQCGGVGVNSALQRGGVGVTVGYQPEAQACEQAEEATEADPHVTHLSSERGRRDHYRLR